MKVEEWKGGGYRDGEEDEKEDKKKEREEEKEEENKKEKVFHNISLYNIKGPQSESTMLKCFSPNILPSIRERKIPF